jgi:hypothetical protein
MHEVLSVTVLIILYANFGWGGFATALLKNEIMVLYGSEDLRGKSP